MREPASLPTFQRPMQFGSLRFRSGASRMKHRRSCRRCAEKAAIGRPTTSSRDMWCALVCIWSTTGQDYSHHTILPWRTQKWDRQPVRSDTDGWSVG